MNKNLFNIYYINVSKVYELAMILNNKVSNSLIKETASEQENKREKSSSVNAKYLDSIGSEIKDTGFMRKSKSDKVIETLDIKMTKSILLRNILNKCKTVGKKNFGNTGDLIHINNISFNLENETEIRSIKMVKNNAIKDFKIEGFDLNNLINSIIADYFYILTGTISNNKRKIIIKIPMECGTEFENLYTIDDLLIGKVDLIGINRGIIKKENLKNSLNFFSEIENLDEKNKDSFNYDESDSTMKMKETNALDSVKNAYTNDEYDFIDVIAIIQNVNQNKEQTPLSNNTTINKKWYKKILNKFFRRFKKC